MSAVTCDNKASARVEEKVQQARSKGSVTVALEDGVELRRSCNEIKMSIFNLRLSRMYSIKQGMGGGVKEVRGTTRAQTFGRCSRTEVARAHTE